jgi:hypothetical protein
MKGSALPPAALEQVLNQTIGTPCSLCRARRALVRRDSGTHTRLGTTNRFFPGLVRIARVACSYLLSPGTPRGRLRLRLVTNHRVRTCILHTGRPSHWAFLDPAGQGRPNPEVNSSNSWSDTVGFATTRENSTSLLMGRRRGSIVYDIRAGRSATGISKSKYWPPHGSGQLDRLKSAGPAHARAVAAEDSRRVGSFSKPSTPTCFYSCRLAIKPTSHLGHRRN